MPKISVYTLGCKVNQAETETMLASFSKAGFEYVDFSEQADVYIINTCTVTKEADRKSRQVIRRATKRKGNALVIVTGCYAEISPQEIASIPGVDLVVPQSEKHNLVGHALRHYSDVGSLLPALCSLPTQRLRTRAFLKIQDGCDSYCSYCIVPFARGKPRSELLNEIVRKARKLAGEGVQEIVLTGVHLGKYGKDLPGRPSLVDLLKEMLAVPKLGRIRLSSIEPEEISLDLIDLISKHLHTCASVKVGRICRHLHIPLQSGDDEILHRMGRKYTASQYEDLVIALKRQIPGIAITTDVMVGFPGESDERFEKTLGLVERLGLAKLHVFRFSPREGTSAATFPGQVAEDTKRRRSEILLQLNEKLSRNFRAAFIGQALEVLVEKRVNGQLTGLTDNYLRVFVDGKDKIVGELIDTELLK